MRKHMITTIAIAVIAWGSVGTVEASIRDFWTPDSPGMIVEHESDRENVLIAKNIQFMYFYNREYRFFYDNYGREIFRLSGYPGLDCEFSLCTEKGTVIIKEGNENYDSDSEKSQMFAALMLYNTQGLQQQEYYKMTSEGFVCHENLFYEYSDDGTYYRSDGSTGVYDPNSGRLIREKTYGQKIDDMYLDMKEYDMVYNSKDSLISDGHSKLFYVYDSLGREEVCIKAYNRNSGCPTVTYYSYGKLENHIPGELSGRWIEDVTDKEAVERNIPRRMMLISCTGEIVLAEIDELSGIPVIKITGTCVYEDGTFTICGETFADGKHDQKHEIYRNVEVIQDCLIIGESTYKRQ